MAIETSYDNWGGSGDRRDIIMITDSGFDKYSPWNLKNLVDGVNTTAIVFFQTTQPGATITFKFSQSVLLGGIRLKRDDRGEVRFKVVVNDSEVGLVSNRNGELLFDNTVSDTVKLIVYDYPSGDAKFVNEVEFKTAFPPINKTLILTENEYKNYKESDTLPAHKFNFDEQGGSATDSTGNAVGSLVGGVNRVAGFGGQGKALELDGVSGHVQFNQKLVPLGEVSIRLKLKMDSIPSGSNSELLSNVFATAGRGIRSWIDTAGKLVFTGVMASSGNWNFHTEFLFPFDGEWHDILFTWDGTTNNNGVKLYVDDMSVPKDSDKAITTNSHAGDYNLVLGKAADRDDRYLKGQVDNLEIYDYIINPLDINFDKGWKLVSTTTPTAQQFQEKGMEDLSILDRKIQLVLDSPIQMNNDGVLGEGKVFKGKVDLKKYFDLRKLEVK